MDAAEYCLKYLAGTENLCIRYGCTKCTKSDALLEHAWIVEYFQRK